MHDLAAFIRDLEALQALYGEVGEASAPGQSIPTPSPAQNVPNEVSITPTVNLSVFSGTRLNGWRTSAPISRPTGRTVRRNEVLVVPPFPSLTVRVMVVEPNWSGSGAKDRLPVVVWGNGGCAIDAPRYGGFLQTIGNAQVTTQAFGTTTVNGQATILANTTGAGASHTQVTIDNLVRGPGGFVVFRADPRPDDPAGHAAEIQILEFVAAFRAVEQILAEAEPGAAA